MLHDQETLKSEKVLILERGDKKNKREYNYRKLNVLQLQFLEVSQQDEDWLKAIKRNYMVSGLEDLLTITRTKAVGRDKAVEHSCKIVSYQNHIKGIKRAKLLMLECLLKIETQEKITINKSLIRQGSQVLFTQSIKYRLYYTIKC